MSVSVARKRRNKVKLKMTAQAREPMELLGFEGSRHMIPQRLPSARKEKMVGIRVIDMNTTAIDNIKETAHTLKRLDLSSLSLSKLNEEFIETLRTLERLDLSNNCLDEDSFPNVFKKLDMLVELVLEKNQLTVLPQVVKRLKDLRRLKVGHNKLTSLEGIDKLKRLQILIIENNNIETLPREIYLNLKKLEIFHVANNRLRDIHVEVRFLRYLKDIDVSGNKLTSVPSELLLLPRLEVLNASGNSISRIPSINVKGRMSHKLSHIDLSDNVLIKFPEHLLSMTDKLDICKNKIKSIPGSVLKKLDFSSGQELLIHENPLINPPQDICDCGIRSIVQFFQEAKAEMKVYQGIKALVIGASGSGKTSLVQTMVDQQSRLTLNGESTIGVDMYDLDIDLEEDNPQVHGHQPLNSKPNADDDDDNEKGLHDRKEKVVLPKPLQVSLWDFSGNSQYFQSHQFFVQDPALVILVFNMVEYDDSKFNETIGFWMDFVIGKTKNINLLPVGTMADLVTPERAADVCESVIKHIHKFIDKKKDLLTGEITKIESMPHIPSVLSEQLKSFYKLLKAEVEIKDQVVAVSSAEYIGIDVLFKSIETMALNKDWFPNVMRVIPSLWSEVENYVEDKAWSTAIPYMKWDEYCNEITNKFGMKHLMGPITRYLHDTGKVIWYSEHNRLKDFVFLRPSWLADVIKHIFRHNIADIDYAMEENFKHNGISYEKFNSITSAILKEGIVDRDYLKGAWAGLIPFDSTKATVEVLYVLLEYFELGYRHVKPGSDHKVKIHSSRGPGSRSSIHPSDSKMSVNDKDDIEGKIDHDVTREGKGTKKESSKKEDQTPSIPKIHKIVVPFIRKATVPQAFTDEYNTFKFNPHLVANYRFPWSLPDGLFETVCVRALKEVHNFTLLHQWDVGLYVQSNEKPYRLFIEKRMHHTGQNCIMIEVRHQQRVQDSEVEHMWAVLLPFLKDIEDLMQKFAGLWVQRHMGCPKCGDILSFFGEWLTPKELQSLSSKKCSVCQQDISTCFLIQPKEKKRVEEFLLRKLKRDAEKRRASQVMEAISENAAVPQPDTKMTTTTRNKTPVIPEEETDLKNNKSKTDETIYHLNSQHETEQNTQQNITLQDVREEQNAENDSDQILGNDNFKRFSLSEEMPPSNDCYVKSELSSTKRRSPLNNRLSKQEMLLEGDLSENDVVTDINISSEERLNLSQNERDGTEDLMEDDCLVSLAVVSSGHRSPLQNRLSKQEKSQKKHPQQNPYKQAQQPNMNQEKRNNQQQIHQQDNIMQMEQTKEQQHQEHKQQRKQSAKKTKPDTLKEDETTSMPFEYFQSTTKKKNSAKNQESGDNYHQVTPPEYFNKQESSTNGRGPVHGNAGRNMQFLVRDREEQNYIIDTHGIIPMINRKDGKD